MEEAKKVGAKIFFEDECGIALNIFSGKTWSLKGITPILFRSGQRTKRTLISAISADGDLYYETIEGGTTGEKYKSFLNNLYSMDDSVKFIIHDGLSSHKCNVVKTFVDSMNGKLKIFQFPGYSPELNPDELVWAKLKKELGKKSHKSLDELKFNAVKIMDEIKNNKEMISSFCNHVYREKSFPI